MFTEGALLLERAAQSLPRRGPHRAQGPRRRREGGPRHGAAGPGTLLGRGLPRRRRDPAPGTRCATWSRPRVPTRSSPTASERSSAAGTSSSRAPRAPTSTSRPARSCPAPSPPPRSGSPAVAGMGFDVIYLPPIHPIGEVNRKGPNNTLTPGSDDVGSPWAIGSKDGGHDTVHPDLGHDRRLRRVRPAGRRAGPRGGPRPRAAGCPRPPVGDVAPRVVHHPRRRHDRLRGEPPEEVPGHLPDQLRQRPRRHLQRGAPGGAALDVARGPHLPGRQPAHQARAVLAVAASPRCARPTPTCCSCPRRSPSRR